MVFRKKWKCEYRIPTRSTQRCLGFIQNSQENAITHDISGGLHVCLKFILLPWRQIYSTDTRYGMLYNGWWAQPDLTIQFILYNMINLTMNMVMHRAWDKDTKVQSASIRWQWSQVFTKDKPINCTKTKRGRAGDAMRLVYIFSAEGMLGFQLLATEVPKLSKPSMVK